MKIQIDLPLTVLWSHGHGYYVGVPGFSSMHSLSAQEAFRLLRRLGVETPEVTMRRAIECKESAAVDALYAQRKKAHTELNDYLGELADQLLGSADQL
jgi:hypothetical protein